MAAARHGRCSAVITRTGDDPFGRFVRNARGQLGVDDCYVSTVPGRATPVAEASELEPTLRARTAYEEAKMHQRRYW